MDLPLSEGGPLIGVKTCRLRRRLNITGGVLQQTISGPIAETDQRIGLHTARKTSRENHSPNIILAKRFIRTIQGCSILLIFVKSEERRMIFFGKLVTYRGQGQKHACRVGS